MKTEWDYTQLADAYLKRPDYAPDALNRIFAVSGLKKGDKVCDIGAGVGHLTLPLASFGAEVDSVEPNDAMRANGVKRTAEFANVSWSEGTGEATGRPGGQYDLVTFGSSFNVCDRQKALAETSRLLKPGKWFACLWNHRDLDDKIQKRIEAIIAANIPGYSYGARREDQSRIIEACGLFEDICQFEGKIEWEQGVQDVLEAWRSHATLQRQAKEKFAAIIGQIGEFLVGLNTETIMIPYTTRVWMARKKAEA